MNFSGNASNVTTTDSTPSIWQRFDDFQGLFQEFRPAMYYYRIYMPLLWILIGIPGNVISVVVWTKPRLKSSSGHYLAVGALFDLLNQIMRFFHTLDKVISVRIYDYSVVCQVSSMLFTTCQYNHTLLILAFTVERFIAISHPFARHKLCTRAKAVKVILGLVTFSLLVSSIQAYFYYNDDVYGCSIRGSVMTGGFASLWNIWTWTTELFFFGVVPVAILIFNINLILAIRKSERTQQENLQYFRTEASENSLSNGHQEAAADAGKARRQKSLTVTSLTLLSLSFYTILMEVPVTILYCLYVAFPPGDLYVSNDELWLSAAWTRFLNYYTVRFCIENFAASHYAVGFYISLFTTRTFRYEVARIFMKCSSCAKQEQTGGPTKARDRGFGFYAPCMGDGRALGAKHDSSEYDSSIVRSSPRL